MLGDLDAAVHGLWGQGREGARHGGAAPAPHGAAATVEQRPRDSRAGRRPRHLLLHAIQRPRRRKQPRVLRRIRVAEHHFLVAVPGLELASPQRVVEQRAHDARGVLQVFEGLEQRDDVEAGVGGLARQIHEPGLAR